MMQSKIISKLVPRWGSIQTQLILGFGPILILTLITAIAGYWGLQSLRTGIETTIEEASQVRELSREIENEFLLARQSEADFVAKWRSMGFAAAEAEYIAANQRHLAQAQTALDEIESLTRAAHDEELRGMTAPIAELRPLLGTYETAFLATVANVEERSRPDGSESALRSELDDLENTVAPLLNPEFHRR